jgi:RNA polymerase sigma-70 factor (ECF subfamily)
MGSVMAESSFEAVVAAHHLEIHRYLARITRRASEADDLSQETFLRAFRAFGSLPPEANVRAWLFAIATNLCRNHFRREGRRRRAYAAAANGPVGSGGNSAPEEEAVLNEVGSRVEGIVATLPLKQRLAFIMRKVHELEYEAIAASLGCSGESARAHVFQALRKIRRGLEEPAMAVAEPNQ